MGLRRRSPMPLQACICRATLEYLVQWESICLDREGALKKNLYDLRA